MGNSYEEWKLSQEEEAARPPEQVKPPEVLTAKQLLEREFPDQQWLIDKFLPEESITLIVGEAGTLKSYIGLYIAKALTTKEPFLGHYEVFSSPNILIIDKENKLRRIKRRMLGLNFPQTDNVFFLEYPEQFSFRNQKMMAFFKQYIEEHQIKVVLFDSFIDMFEGNENSSTDTARAFDDIRSLSHNSSYILLHHDSKPIPKMVRTAAQKTRGSSNIIAQVDTQFYFEKGKDGKTLIIEQGKSRDEQPLNRFGVDIISNEEGGIIDFMYKGEFKSDIKLIEEAKEWIYSYIVDHPLTAKEELVNEGEGLSFTTRIIQDAITSLKKEKLIDGIKKPGQGNRMYYLLLGEPLVPEETENTL